MHQGAKGSFPTAIQKKIQHNDRVRPSVCVLSVRERNSPNEPKEDVPLSLNFFNVGPTSKMQAASRWGILRIGFSSTRKCCSK